MNENAAPTVVPMRGLVNPPANVTELSTQLAAACWGWKESVVQKGDAVGTPEAVACKAILHPEAESTMMTILVIFALIGFIAGP